MASKKRNKKQKPATVTSHPSIARHTRPPEKSAPVVSGKLPHQPPAGPAKQVPATGPTQKLRVGPSVAPSRHAGSPPKLPFSREIPSLYHETYLRMIPLGPHHFYSFWEIGPEALKKAKDLSEHVSNDVEAQPVLRLYTLNPKGKNRPGTHRIGDIPLAPSINSYYIRVPESGQTYRLDLGVMTPSGRFLTLCQSNEAATPRARVGSSPANEREGRRGRTDTQKLIDFSLLSGKTIAETDADREGPRGRGRLIDFSLLSGKTMAGNDGRRFLLEIDEALAVDPENDEAGRTESSWNARPVAPETYPHR